MCRRDGNAKSQKKRKKVRIRATQKLISMPFETVLNVLSPKDWVGACPMRKNEKKKN